MSILVDLRLAIRSVRRQPGIAVMAMLAFGLGIGLPAAMFSLIRSVATRGLPVADGSRLMYLERRPEGASGEGWGAAPRDFTAWREQQTSFEQLAAFTTETVAVRVGQGAERFEAAYLTANAFGVLSVSPSLGRGFREGDDRRSAVPVVLISHRMWTDRFSSDRNVLDRTIFVNGRAYSIIGVMPEGFRFPFQQDLWAPLVLPPDAATAAEPNLSVFGRLADGVSRGHARAQFAIIASRVEQQFPESNRDMGVTVKPFTEQLIGETPMKQFRVMMVAVLFVLIIACTNVANLLLVRAVHRVRDLAVRTALGAGRLRIVAQLQLESTVMAVMGGVLAVGVAMAAVGGLRHWLSSDRLPYWVDMRLDGMTLLYMLALTVAAGLLAGALPAIKATVKDVNAILKDEARGSSSMKIGRIMHSLIALEIALSMGLLIATGLMIQSVRNVRNVRLGFDTASTLTARMALPESYDEDARRRFMRALSTRLADDPSIASSTIASDLPVMRAGLTRLVVEGQAYSSETAMPRASRVAVSPGFFATFDANLIAGRPFGPADGPDAEPVVIINQRAAQRLFPNQDPIGRRIRLGGENTTDAWRTIVGISPDLWANGLDYSFDRNPPAAYVPAAQQPPRIISVAATRRGPTGRVVDLLRSAAAAADPAVPVYDVKDMGEVIEDNSWFFGFGASILAACGLSAFILAAIGLYGVTAFSVERRTREIGIRIALGAAPAGIVRLVLLRGGRQVVAGTVLGLGLAYLLGLGVTSLLFLVDPSDPRVFATFGSLLIAIAVIVTLIPAMMASRIDALSALRAD